jgi:hypothetical protein
VFVVIKDQYFATLRIGLRSTTFRAINLGMVNSLDIGLIKVGKSKTLICGRDSRHTFAYYGKSVLQVYGKRYFSIE